MLVQAHDFLNECRYRVLITKKGCILLFSFVLLRMRPRRRRRRRRFFPLRIFPFFTVKVCLFRLRNNTGRTILPQNLQEILKFNDLFLESNID